ncbi:LOW QUALITY PROTEIN: sialic acid-binding Ig-like lectin 5 [Acomys russatus]|uniref:LOW QUALITY PROTEIN: sialic acid-binding Ig-like lectin 5 n=1 Tax=Acomys russatus TaxID=60746 RepID=UPI0021E29575|nr:LOW QUALITY PROTEIN: sialic acid-binding Ig-like lectin 5 [Acomys russatus]
MLCGLTALPLMYLGLLSPVSVDIKKMAVEDGPCSTVPCVIEFSKASPRNPMTVSYRLNENISFHVGTSRSSAPRGDLSMEEEEYCILLTHAMLRRESMAASLSVSLGDEKDTVLRENPELHIPEHGAAGEPVALTCTIQDTCLEPKAPFLSWKGPNMIIAINSSSELTTAPKPEDQGSTLRCHLKLFPDNLSSSKMLNLQLLSPARLLNYSCLVTRTLVCSCSFYGIPTPSVQWWVGGTSVSMNSIDRILHVTTTTLEPWTNSTIHLMWEPAIITRLRCEGKNQYGIHASKILLIPDKSSISSVFLRGLVQGIVYGTIASVLLFFFLTVLVMKMLSWWKENQTCNNKEAPTPKKPVSGEAKMPEKQRLQTHAVASALPQLNQNGGLSLGLLILHMEVSWNNRTVPPSDYGKDPLELQGHHFPTVEVFQTPANGGC